MGQTAAIFVTQVTNSNSLLTERESLISGINIQVCNVVLLCFLIPVNCLFTLVNMLHNYQLTHICWLPYICVRRVLAFIWEHWADWTGRLLGYSVIRVITIGSLLEAAAAIEDGLLACRKSNISHVSCSVHSCPGGIFTACGRKLQADIMMWSLLISSGIFELFSWLHVSNGSVNNTAAQSFGRFLCPQTFPHTSLFFLLTGKLWRPI